MNDPDRQGLLSIAFRSVMSGEEVLSPRTLPLAKELLAFATQPESS